LFSHAGQSKLPQTPFTKRLKPFNKGTTSRQKYDSIIAVQIKDL